MPEPPGLQAAFHPSDAPVAPGLRVVSVGEPLAPGDAPAASVTVTDVRGVPVLRVDLFGPDWTAFQDAQVWQGRLVVGFGEQVHLVPLDGGPPLTHDLGDYFGHLYPRTDGLLVASGVRLFRLTPTGQVWWVTEPLAVDGVLVHDVLDGIISGDAEHDPPGGWLPFQVSLATGARLPHP